MNIAISLPFCFSQAVERVAERPAERPAPEPSLAGAIGEAVMPFAMGMPGNPVAAGIGQQLGEAIASWWNSLPEEPAAGGEAPFDVKIDWGCFQAEAAPAPAPAAPARPAPTPAPAASPIDAMFKKTFGYEVTEPARAFYEGQLKLFNGDTCRLQQYMESYRDDLRGKGVL